jgi:beta-galactosidase
MKRNVLKYLAAIVALAGTPAIAQPRQTSPRQSVDLAAGWRFHQGEAPAGVEAPGFADAGWQAVSVPHTWNRVGYYIPDPASHLNRPDNINKTQGLGWYRLSFTAPAGLTGKRAWLEFDAASRRAEVWLNGVRLGAHDGGFSRFRLDATPALKPGQRNVLVVKTDNSAPSGRSGTGDILPLAGDFFIHGGLYRSVRLVATDPVHIDMQDFGGPGVYASTRSIADGGAAIDVRIKLRNAGGSGVPVSVVTRLVDAAGQTVAEHIDRIQLAGAAGGTVEQRLDVARVRLWQGTADPYLYSLVAELRGPGGAVLDQVSQPYGVREMRVDPNRGFLLNGRPYRLKGVGFHQDTEGKGWAQSKADVARDIAIIREMGANSIRLTHYQHGPAIHELADRYGLILWDEIPLVSVWTAGRATEATPGLKANAQQQLRELIRQNYNHASVAVWGIANEVDFGASLPGYMTSGQGSPDPLPLLRELNALAKAEDPTRPTTLATCCEGRLFAANVEIPIASSAVDLGGANRYFGWYFGKVDDLGPHLEALRSKRPAQPLSVTEYGAGGATTMHSDDPRGGPPASRGREQPEEYMSYIHEESWRQLAARPWLWGTWLWNSFDFATTVRREGDAEDINTKGLVTYDRKIRKDAYFFYKANWSGAPTLHINGRRYVDRAYGVTGVRVYSNAPVTRLTVNGRPLGSRANCPQKTCVWENVRLRVGDNDVVASAGKLQDRVQWRLSPDAASHVRIDSGALMAPQAASPRFGSDAFFLGGEAASANRAADYGRPVQKAVIAGAANSDIASTFRTGDFRYAIPLENGDYTLTLTFVEPGAKPGERSFDVAANGAILLNRFDIAAAAGGPLKALVRTFPVRVRNGRLDLHFRPGSGPASVSSIEVARSK